VTDAVRSLIQQPDRHGWSLDELLAAVRQDIRSANFATIFRAIATLERQGSVNRVDLGDGKARYEMRQEHHEHIRCTGCGNVAEVPGCVVEEATSGVQASTGYVVTNHQVVFSGLCPACAPVAPVPPVPLPSRESLGEGD
jgi:Fe2+ or Zn2+ uptake regulation protein